MKKLLFLALSLILVITCTACGSAKESDFQAPNMMDGVAADDYYPEDSKSESSNGGLMDSEPGTENPAENDLSSRKLIKRVRMEIQTEEYDKFLDSIDALIASTGAYVQNSTMYDRGGKSSNRSATFIVRVPADRLSQFTNGVYDGATVTYYNEDLEDVTASYKDIKSRIESLQIELDALNKLLAEAVDLQYVISLHDRITDIRYELDMYESSIRNYDELISYSTVTLNISEVKRAVIVDEQSTWEEIGTNLSENMSDIGEFFRQLFIGIASSLPYILILVVVFGGITLIIVASVKKHNKKNSDKKSNDK